MSAPKASRQRVYVLTLRDYDDAEIQGVYASAEAADKAQTAWNRKHPFSHLTPCIDGPFIVRGVVA